MSTMTGPTLRHSWRTSASITTWRMIDSGIASKFADLYHQDDEDWQACEDHCKPPAVDRLFTKRQLYYINRDRGNSSLFMSHMDLDLDNEDNGIEAQALAEDFCFESDGDDDDDAYYLDEYGIRKDELEEHMDGHELVDPEILASRSRDQMLGYLNVGTYVTGPRKLAEHLLSEEELNFVNQTYGDSMSFMTCFDLKFYEEEDWLEAKSIVAAVVRRMSIEELRN
ncbi:hypothetical protein J3459_007575 [Metarhizium acridum]|nr:hypothetical protein J3459_007575 [Metarhizium acridum]